MKKIGISVLALLFLFLVPESAMAGGGAAGVAPGTGFTLRFGSGGTDVYIPIILTGEYQAGDDRQHGIGGEFGGQIWTGFGNFNLVHIGLYYQHYFNGGEESGAYAGAYTNFGVKSSFSSISVGGKGGYQHFFNDWIGIFAEGRVGFNTLGSKFSSSRNNGGEFGLVAGAKFSF